MVRLVTRRQGDGWTCPAINIDFEEDASIVIGRSKELRIPAAEICISRHHARIQFDGTDFVLHPSKRTFYKKARGRKVYSIAAGESYKV